MTKSLTLSQLVEQQKYHINRHKNKTIILMKIDIIILKYLQSGKKGLSTFVAKEECKLSTVGIRNSANRLKREGFIQQHEDKEYSITELGRQLYECTKHII